MLNRELLENQLAEFPLFAYGFIDPKTLEFTQRVRYICQSECPMFGKSWACPPAVGDVEECKRRCMAYTDCLMIATITEVADIADVQAALATRGEHEALTNAVAALLRQQGIEPYILSTEACAECERCAYLDGQPCRFPERMHPCVESHGINVVPAMEAIGIPFISGENLVTWVSLLLFAEEI
jgi:predicted metal-binding protein